ncbi:hypothetical protein JHW43_006654 [Diplocarpon mali]|nr:hypothetical protein JHW43_006654 [Diplocarpon mali]
MLSLPAASMQRSISPLQNGLRRQHILSWGSSPAAFVSRPYNTLHRRYLSSQTYSAALRHSTCIQSPKSRFFRDRLFSSEAEPLREIPEFAFAFDIDGVLLRSSTPLPGASKALAYLQKNSIPFILLTNGGGKIESERVQELSEKLGVPLSEDNFVQSHTPFKDLLDDNGPRKGLRNSTILVTGGDGDKCRQVAESYGFKHVVTPADIITAEPDIWPFSQAFSEYYKSTARPLPNSLDPSKAADPLKIDAIFVFNDPRDWALDIQIIIDLLMSKQGILGTYSEMNGNTTLPDNGWQKDGTPKLYFSNPDLLWAAAYPLPRFGQGAFQAALTGVWRQATSQPKLHCITIGKPHRASYKYAEKVLNKHRTEILGGSSVTESSPLLKVFMIGDNPESDIRGSNSYDSKSKAAWSSILVKTGVYQDGAVPSYEPDVIVDDVLEGVKWALKERRWKGEIE